MKYKNQKNKIKTEIYEKRLKNELELDKKNNYFPIQNLNNNVFKIPKTLYDSGWITAKWSSESIAELPVWITANYYSDKEGTVLPFNVQFMFQKDWNIPKQYLSYIKPVIMIDSISTDIKIHGITPRLTYWKWKSNYKEINGDSELLYKGYEVGYDKYYTYSEDNIDNGNILSSHTSNWYKATIEWIQNDGIERKIVNGLISWINISYNFSHTIYDSEESSYWNYYYFSGGAFDDLSSTNMIGQGLWSHNWWEGSGSSPNVVWTVQNESEKNKQQTINILGNASTQITLKGSYYEKESGEWVYKGILEKTAYHGLAYAPPSDNPDFMITSFSVQRDKNTNDKYLYRLWYSVKRARYFSAYDDSTWILNNFPISTDYEGGILPYTNITYNVNPDPYPIEEYPGWEQKGIDYKASTNNSLVWIKTSLGTEDTLESSIHDRYGIKLTGNIYCTASAHYNLGTTTYWVNELYDNDGSSYFRHDLNRGNDKIINRFTIEPLEVNFRFQLICNNPICYEQIKKYMEI